MEVGKMRLLEFIGSSKRTFNIPVYQRNYDWGKEPCEKFFKDIEKIALNNCETEHFIGTVVYVNLKSNAQYAQYTLIDGQQRITSATLLLKALHDTIDDECTKEEIYEIYIINKNASEKLRIKLKPIESDAISYSALIDDNKHTQSNIFRNYELFKTLISESNISAKEIYNAMHLIELVCIQLDKENPQIIFESINSTGLSLTEADLIRNFLLMNHVPDEQIRLYKQYWVEIEKHLSNAVISDFVRDYLTMKKRVICNKKAIYATFKDFTKHSKNGGGEEDWLDDLKMHAEYYAWFLSCNSPYKQINTCLSELQVLNITTVYPALLDIFEDCFMYRKLDIDELEKVLHVIISYLYRRLICEYNGNALGLTFAKFPDDIKKSEKESYSEKVLDILSSKISKSAFPKNKEFKTAFIRNQIYKKSNIANYTLKKLESNYSKETVDWTDAITIEHIMPQKLGSDWQINLGNKHEEIRSEWCDTIGNLTFTGYNGTLSNSSFENKKTTYKDSNITITRSLRDFENWNAETIKQRANNLYEVAEKIWALPEEYNKINRQTIDYTEEYNIMDEIDVTGEKPREITVLDMQYSVTSWKKFFLMLCEKLYDYNSDAFRDLTRYGNFKSEKRNIIDTKCDNMQSPYRIADSLYIETNLNANAIINYCRLIAEHYNAQDEIFFRLSKK